jgi:hypothetical protein
LDEFMSVAVMSTAEYGLGRNVLDNEHDRQLVSVGLHQDGV